MRVPFILSASRAIADEVRNSNVVTVVRECAGWVATIGPDPVRGLSATGGSARAALLHLADRVDVERWIFDPSWRPKEIGYHDA